MTTATALPTANFARRFMALVYDLFLMLGIAFPYGVVITLIRIQLGQDTLNPPSPLVGIIIVLGLWMLCALFYCWCWRRQGQTLGMKSWRIKLSNQDQQLLSWKQCWQRCLWATLGNALCGLGLLWCLVDKNKSSLYDRITGNQVTVLPKQ